MATIIFYLYHMENPQTPPIQLSTFWPYQVSVLADQISRYTLSIAKAEAGLNLSQWRVLAAVAEKPGRTSASVVAVTPMDKGIVSRAVSTLIELGLIIKTADDTDKRRFSLETTTLGQTHYSKIAKCLNATMIKAFRGDTSPRDFIAALSEHIGHMDHLSPSGE